eukprot:NODE_6309_length_364_cov_29.476190_g5588_i0.p1 GENE.NODE_6309_length_364_cov_29.476190_g5588_i0~~NODE_6309_length_364_cov_29.476190_g5588_i0.p1  ORF type:complete len:96 (-),score=4.41 NODE_6309_length_364_cov_29.476190_g5588_i0:35-322(-)
MPGGLDIDTEQLRGLVAAKKIDFFERQTARKLVLYWRSITPGSEKRVPLSLTAVVPGLFSSPPWVAYEYYADAARVFLAPVRANISLRKPSTRRM